MLPFPAVNLSTCLLACFSRGAVNVFQSHVSENHTGRCKEVAHIYIDVFALRSCAQERYLSLVRCGHTLLVPGCRKNSLKISGRSLLLGAT